MTVATYDTEDDTGECWSVAILSSWSREVAGRRPHACQELTARLTQYDLVTPRGRPKLFLPELANFLLLHLISSDPFDANRQQFSAMVSQLKRLKASLRQAGVVGPQKSKKAAKKGRDGKDSRIDFQDKLSSIREEMNPFETKFTKRKFEVIGAEKVKGVKGRPGVSKQIGEETVGNLVLEG